MFLPSTRRAVNWDYPPQLFPEFLENDGYNTNRIEHKMAIFHEDIRFPHYLLTDYII